MIPIWKTDLSSWRAAGVGAEMIRPDTLRNFAEKFAPAGFDARAFLPCYGLAESTLAVTFSQVGQGFQSLQVDAGRWLTKKWRCGYKWKAGNIANL